MTLAGDVGRRARVPRSAESQQGHSTPARAAAVKSALDKTEKGKPNKAAIDQLDTVAQQLEQDAASASGKDADRMKALALDDEGPRIQTADELVSQPASQKPYNRRAVRITVIK